jgi:glycosyltransferase involved in cell wall biosynthesis
MDRTFVIGRTWQAAHFEHRVTVLRNEYNQGYGGNQKVGCRYAIKEGFDYVAMVHGDGQYAPEELPRLLEPLVKGEAEVVLGSRMLEAGRARKGRMPLYKWLGNRVLTTMQNALLGTRLSEFHSGYRIYRVAALERLPKLSSLTRSSSKPRPRPTRISCWRRQRQLAKNHKLDASGRMLQFTTMQLPLLKPRSVSRT